MKIDNITHGAEPVVDPKTGRALGPLTRIILALNLLVGRTGGILGQALPLETYTVLTLPDAAANARGLIYVSDEAGGAVPAFSDGTNWRRLTDRAVVS